MRRRVLAIAVAMAAVASMWVGVASASALEVNVLNSPYNAKGNGTTNDRVAIQNAINAVNSGGGGTVVLPGGHTYLTGNLILKSKVTLDIATGAVLKQSQTIADYANEPHKGRSIPGGHQYETYLDQNYPLIYAGNASEVNVNGGGEIQMTYNGNDENSILVHGIGFFKVNHYTISNITIKGASAYNVTMRDTENGEIFKVTTTKPNTINSDGISLMDSSHISVHNNNLTTLDDGIYVWASYEDPRKSAWWNSDTALPSHDIQVYENVVNNESTNGSHGFLFINWTGSAPDQSQVEISNINVHNNTFKATYPIAALVQDIYHPTGQKTPSKDLTFANNTLTVVGSGSTTQGLNEMATTDLSVDNSLYNFAQATKAEGIYNSNFDGKNAYSSEVGTSFWSTEGKASAPSTAVGQPGGRYGQITGFNEGYAGIYQGVYFPAGTTTYKFTAATQSSGAPVRMFVIRASNGEVVKSASITNTTWATKSLSFTVPAAGVYRLGIDSSGAGSSATAFGRIDNAELE